MFRFFLIAIAILISLLSILITENKLQSNKESILYNLDYTVLYTSDESGNWDIWKHDLKTGKKEKLTNYSGPDYNPSLSPDGKKIAFTSYRWGGHRIGIMDVDGTNQENLLNTSVGYNLDPSWSPNGKDITFFMVDKGFWQIFKYNFETQKLTDLSALDNTSDRSPSWSPDGEYIAFQSIRDGNWEIYVMRKDGSEVRRLTSNNYDDYLPSWSPDGEKIVFGSNMNNQADVYLINSDGSDLKNLTKGLPEKVKPNGESHKDDINPTFSKDGKYIFWTSGASGSNAILHVMKSDGSEIKELSSGSFDIRFPDAN